MTNTAKYDDLYYTQFSRIVESIVKGNVPSMRYIDQTVYKLYSETELKNVNSDPSYGQNRMLKDLYSLFIIHCDVENKVPKCGYREEV